MQISCWPDFCLKKGHHRQWLLCVSQMVDQQKRWSFKSRSLTYSVCVHWAHFVHYLLLLVFLVFLVFQLSCSFQLTLSLPTPSSDLNFISIEQTPIVGSCSDFNKKSEKKINLFAHTLSLSVNVRGAGLADYRLYTELLNGASKKNSLIEPVLYISYTRLEVSKTV